MSADIPEALRTLHEGLAKMSDEEASGGSPSSPGAAAPVASTSRSQSYDEEDDAKPIALHTRAGPLISLLEAAAEAGESVQWDS